VLPVEVADRIELEHLVIGPAKSRSRDRADLGVVRAAIRGERKLPSGGGVWPRGADCCQFLTRRPRALPAGGSP
jgi:hypothetical protein